MPGTIDQNYIQFGHSVWFMILQPLSSSAVHGVIPLEGKHPSPSIYLARYSSFLFFIHAKPFCKGGIMILVLKMRKWVEEVNWQGQDFAEVVVEFRFARSSAGTHQSTPSPGLHLTVTLTALTLRGLISWAWTASDGCSPQLEFKYSICSIWAGGWIWAGAALMLWFSVF